MKHRLVNKKSFVLLSIFLAGFLVLPKVILAEDFENITPEEIEKHIQLPPDKVEDLIRSLISLFHSEWEKQMTSGYSTAEERAVPIILRGATRAQALNHLLIDAPVEVTFGIVENGVKIARLLEIGDISGLLNELEKQGTKRAINYGMKHLLQNEIRITPGAIKFKYDLEKGGTKETIFQYIMVYKPIDAKRGNLVIRFYSTEYLEPPVNKGSYGGATGIPTELTHPLPPFIVDIQGEVENYKWVGQPSVKIDFSGPVPDLGIRPLSFLERQIWKPIIAQIKEVEVIITKVTGKSPKVTEKIFKIPQVVADIWDKITGKIQELTKFGGAQITVPPEEKSIGQEVGQEKSEEKEIEESETKPEVKPTKSVEERIEVKPQSPKPPDLREIRKNLTEISKTIEGLSKRVKELSNVDIKRQQEIEEEGKKGKEKVEEEQSQKEKEIQKETKKEQSQITICQKKIGDSPLRNKVIFNELAWMGTLNSANDEWIEIKNISGGQIDLAGWQILDKDGQIKIIFERGQTSSNGFRLLERTNDDTVPGIAADLIYTGGLNNSDEALYLFDENCQLQDEVIANPDWPAGNNSTKRTMERKSDLSWQTSSNPGGTPKRENSAGYIEIPLTSSSGSGTDGSSGGGGTPPPPEPTSYPKILISEIQIASQTNEKDDFVELFNPNDSDLDLTSWYLQRKTKGAEDFSSYAPESLFSGKVIKTHGYFLIANASSTFSASATTTYPLTEDNTLYLKNPNGQIADKVGWGNAQDFETATTTNPPAGQSTGRKWSTTTQTYIDTDNNREDFGIQTPTPKTQNQSPPSSPSNQSPNAIFTYSPANPIRNQEIVFNGSFSTDTDGVILSYFWDFNEGTSTGVTTTYSYLTSGTFTVTLLITDERGATSSTSTIIEISANSPVVPPTHILITEVGAVGQEEFVEIYNPTDEATSTASWYLSYFSSTKNWNDPSYNKSFSNSPTTTIPAKSYFLVGFGDYNDPKMDWKADGRNLSNTNGAIGVFSGNPAATTTSTETIERAKAFKIDVLGWGNPIVKEENSIESTSSEESFARKIATTSEGVLTYIDSDNNSSDFEIQDPTAKARNQHQFSDLDGDGIIDSYDSTTTIATTTELKAGEYKFKDLVIINGGKLVLNSSSSLAGFQGVKILAENLFIDASSSISADGKGYPSNEGPGRGGLGRCDGGGSYGGIGGYNLATSTYGSSTQPTDLGSGGGGCDRPAGAGSGAIWLKIENSLIIDGVISANGENGLWRNGGWWATGGGSGGSIYIETNILKGSASGTISATGGDTDSAGAGGGGRIAIIYDLMAEFSGQIRAWGGKFYWGGSNGGPGTIYLKQKEQNYGDLIIDNNSQSGATELSGTSSTFKLLSIVNYARVYFSGNLTANNIQIKNNSTLETATTSQIIVNSDFIIAEKSSLIGPAQIFLFINVAQGLIIQTESRLQGNFNIQTGNLTLATSSLISAQGKGYPLDQGPGRGNLGRYDGGGSYGGIGGFNLATSTYGSSTQPTDLGSGGGGGGRPAGAGGGAIIITANELIFEGSTSSISANGENGLWRNGGWATGGGSGGSIYIETNNFSGPSLITSNGGNTDAAGAGGGGRIAIIYNSMAGFSGQIQTLGGKFSWGGSDGQPGTIYLQKINEVGQLIITGSISLP